ncbi:MAG TPA: amino acid ABC transporter permease [Aurantimonas coralicida]|uniref:Amino acid ABC transporter permease n=2 Tax=root TaxID=1 RepID=A0A9C9TH47_9HYPH|nr:amino acid ABC transporter permease [Aurantimonas coralicida]HEU00423.1 amino acid ABC transporter permease [Aurantimonas coralicida]
MLQSVADWFRELNETTGLNFTVFYDAYDAANFFDGILVTIELTIASVLASLVIGIVGAFVQSAGPLWARMAIDGFVSIFRNTPPLVQMFFFYFGIGSLLPASYNDIGLIEPWLTSFQWAVLALSLFAGAFNIEIFRSGIEAVPKTTVEAAGALGYTSLGQYRYVVLPLALRICLPALTNNLVNLLKTTTLAYTIAVPETLYTVKQIWTAAQNVPEMMSLLLIVYIVLVGILVWIMHAWQRAIEIPGYSR